MHISVLQKEVIEFLSPGPWQVFIDGTAGAGGHSLAILKKIVPNGKLLAIDLDKSALAEIENKIEKENPDLKNSLILANGNFADVWQIAKQNGFLKVNGIVLDLGFSSDQLEESGRGFSFQKDEPLDMRYDISQPLTAFEIINKWPQEKLAEIIKDYGEERFAQKIAREIVDRRKIKSIATTTDFVQIISRAVPKFYHRARIHFATKTFQALRIAVNGELENLERFLHSAYGLLADNGRVIIISFHSLEDRIVKNFFRQAQKERKLSVLTKKPITPSAQEIQINSRSRSAKMRVAQKI